MNSPIAAFLIELRLPNNVEIISDDASSVLPYRRRKTTSIADGSQQRRRRFENNRWGSSANENEISPIPVSPRRKSNRWDSSANNYDNSPMPRRPTRSKSMNMSQSTRWKSNRWESSANNYDNSPMHRRPTRSNSMSMSQSTSSKYITTSRFPARSETNDRQSSPTSSILYSSQSLDQSHKLVATLLTNEDFCPPFQES
jgi:hypothetical protein